MLRAVYGTVVQNKASMWSACTEDQQDPKCQFHGGGQTSGKQTLDGRSRIAAANYKHGESTKVARAEYSKASATLSKLEDAMHLLKMTSAPRTRGRKPSGYKPVRSTQDVIQMVLDTEKH